MNSAAAVKAYYADQGRPPPKPEGCYVLGRNEYSSSLVNAFNIIAVVDDFSGASEFMGRPVITTAELPVGARVISCSLSIWAHTAYRKLRDLGYLDVLGYCEVWSHYPQQLLQPDFLHQTHALQATSGDQLTQLASRLADDKSREILQKLLQFRLYGDVSRDLGFSVRLEEQYFSSVCPLSDREVFVDGGGYTGDTSQAFCRRTGGHEAIYLFEPDTGNMNHARENLSSVPNVTFIPFGLSDKRGETRFSAGSGSASSISEQGETVIQLTTIDRAVDRPVSYIKLDLEGHDLAALQGAREHICADHPKIAVAVYHQADHFLAIPEYVLSLRSDYDLHLRHYTEGWSESVMYFIPRE